jgi:hypothetical protein
MLSKFCVGNLNETDRWGDLGLDGRIILKCVLKKYYGTACTVFIWLRVGTVV